MIPSVIQHDGVGLLISMGINENKLKYKKLTDPIGHTGPLLSPIMEALEW
jgi:hypothetical protein